MKVFSFVGAEVVLWQRQLSLLLPFPETNLAYLCFDKLWGQTRQKRDHELESVVETLLRDDEKALLGVCRHCIEPERVSESVKCLLA